VSPPVDGDGRAVGVDDAAGLGRQLLEVLDNLHVRVGQFLVGEAVPPSILKAPVCLAGDGLAQI